MHAEDVRGLLRLMRETSALGGAREATSLHILRGLADIIGARFGLDFSGALGHGASIEIDSALDLGWSSDGDRACVYDHIGRLKGRAPELARLHGGERVVTLALVDPKAHGAAGTTDEVPSPRVDCIASILRWDGETARSERSKGLAIRGLVFKRAHGDPDFGPRERDLLYLFTSECPLLRRRGPSVTEGVASMSRRERETLRLLLTGAPEKQLAATLGVSGHTAHDYVKAVYRKMRVSGRLELMASTVRRALPVDPEHDAY